MKIRILISLLLFVAGTTAAIAQHDKPHWEIEAGMCVANLYDHANMNPFILDEINTDDDGFTTPTFALEAGYGSFIPTFQFSPACLSIGKNLSFVMDIGLGRPYMMFAFKLAYRFL